MYSVEDSFIKADSGNLPEVDIFMVMEYFNSSRDYISAEMRGVKMGRSARQNYGDNAVGYVQIKNSAPLCYLKAKVTPEHRIKAKNYSVTCTININVKRVVEVKCHDCSASEGGCKHAIAFLMWLHRRSEEPSPTEKKCYWKRSSLSSATTTKKFITTVDFGSSNITNASINDSIEDSIFEDYVTEARSRKIENSLMRYYSSNKYSCLSLHSLGNKFRYTTVTKNRENFLDFCKNEMDENLIVDVEINTRTQSDSVIWQEMRYGRVTASKAYEVLRCKTLDGVLVEKILGAKVFQTSAMSRGLKLESSVLKVLASKTNIIFRRAGIFLSKDLPLIGASPDALGGEFVVEIKCPQSEKTFPNYIDTEGNIKLKYVYQMQMQMHLAKKTKAIFAVAHPGFETNKEITIKYCNYDQELVEQILDGITEFWFKALFTKIV